jgi:hypothetical protein
MKSRQKAVKRGRKAPAARKAAPRKVAALKTVRKTLAPAAPAPPPVAATPKRVRSSGKPTIPPPALQRERRRLPEADVVPTPPSSLNLDRHPSAARSGRADLQTQLSNHNETGPSLTGGDLDADWQSAYSSGDEAPGGDNPTPDQDIVDEIGRSLGLEYEDNEELKGAEKLEERDRHRWELDPASSDDFDDRD